MYQIACMLLPVFDYPGRWRFMPNYRRGISNV